MVKQLPCNRKKRDIYREMLSSIKSTDDGVPQGFVHVLGPLVFLIYVNDISNTMLTFCRLFLDEKSL